jgi:short-subunit dehydrogenase
MGDPFLEKYGPFALVGGACQGIGLAFARALAARGFGLALVDVRRELLAAVADELASRHGVPVQALELDLGLRGAGARLAELAAAREIGLGVACAAIGGVGPFLSEPLEAHRARLAVNCGGPLSLAHALAGPMVERGRGGLVLVSSMAGLQGTGFVASYSATKAFDLALAEGLWFELRPQGVDVLALVPGNTDTPGLRSSSPRKGQESWMRAEDVAAEALEALGREPVHVCGEANRRVVTALDRMRREERLRVMGESTRSLYED